MSSYWIRFDDPLVMDALLDLANVCGWCVNVDDSDQRSFVMIPDCGEIVSQIVSPESPLAVNLARAIQIIKSGPSEKYTLKLNEQEAYALLNLTSTAHQRDIGRVHSKLKVFFK